MLKSHIYMSCFHIYVQITIYMSELQYIYPNRNICIQMVMGDSRKYPYPTTGGMSILTPPPLALGNSKMLIPPLLSEFQNR